MYDGFAALQCEEPCTTKHENYWYYELGTILIPLNFVVPVLYFMSSIQCHNA